MKETRNEKDLWHEEYAVVKIAELNKYLSEEDRNEFWRLFWLIDDRAIGYKEA